MQEDSAVATMHAMIMEQARKPLRAIDRCLPEVGPDQVLVRVSACGVCRTDLHVLDGDLTGPKLPLILGHEIIGRVVATGAEVSEIKEGERVGIPWLGWTCGVCVFCRAGQENLCPLARFTGYTLDGGFATHSLVDNRYCFPVQGSISDANAAPLLCAGLIGHRSYRMAGEGVRLGLYGFGAAAHIVAQVAVHDGREVYAFVRPGDAKAQDFAMRLGAVWSGDSTEMPPEPLDAAILFAPVGSLVPQALRAVRPGGRVVCAGIHMSDIPSFPYDLLWRERSLCSVANLTRQDGTEFLALAPEVPVQTSVETYPLLAANEAIADLRQGRISGAAVLLTD